MFLNPKILQNCAKVYEILQKKKGNFAKKENSNLIYFNSAYEACEGASAIIIGTEWNEFRALNFKKISKILKEKIIFELRNIYIPEDLKDLGFNYYGTGK